MSASLRKAVVLLSGGVDSATTAAVAIESGFAIYALTFRYGQRHEVETVAAGRISSALRAVRHVVQEIDLRAFGGSALTADLEVPKSRSPAEIAQGIPITYVPARNTIFLAFALAFAETVESSDIFIGVNAVDYSGYPDCRPEFIEAFQRLADLATKAGTCGQSIRIHTPLMAMCKGDIIREGLRLGVDFSLTHSCYDPSPVGLACGQCDSCLLRREGFRQAGTVDPIPYCPAR